MILCIICFLKHDLKKLFNMDIRHRNLPWLLLLATCTNIENHVLSWHHMISILYMLSKLSAYLAKHHLLLCLLFYRREVVMALNLNQGWALNWFLLWELSLQIIKSVHLNVHRVSSTITSNHNLCTLLLCQWEPLAAILTQERGRCITSRRQHR